MASNRPFTINLSSTIFNLPDPSTLKNVFVAETRKFDDTRRYNRPLRVQPVQDVIQPSQVQSDLLEDRVEPELVRALETLAVRKKTVEVVETTEHAVDVPAVTEAVPIARIYSRRDIVVIPKRQSQRKYPWTSRLIGSTMFNESFRKLLQFKHAVSVYDKTARTLGIMIDEITQKNLSEVKKGSSNLVLTMGFESIIESGDPYMIDTEGSIILDSEADNILDMMIDKTNITFNQQMSSLLGIKNAERQRDTAKSKIIELLTSMYKKSWQSALDRKYNPSPVGDINITSEDVHVILSHDMRMRLPLSLVNNLEALHARVYKTDNPQSFRQSFKIALLTTCCNYYMFLSPYTYTYENISNTFTELSEDEDTLIERLKKTDIGMYNVMRYDHEMFALSPDIWNILENNYFHIMSPLQMTGGNIPKAYAGFFPSDILFGAQGRVINVSSDDVVMIHPLIAPQLIQRTLVMTKRGRGGQVITVQKKLDMPPRSGMMQNLTLRRKRIFSQPVISEMRGTPTDATIMWRDRQGESTLKNIVESMKSLPSSIGPVDVIDYNYEESLEEIKHIERKIKDASKYL